MRMKSVLIGCWIVLLVGFSLATAGQACGDAGCWEARESIYIYGNAGFTCENGVISGSGTKYDPYIISGWQIFAGGASYAINIEHTTAYFVIRDCLVEGASAAGIRFLNVSDGAVRDCHLMRNERGILFEKSRNNGLVGNLIANNHYGVDLVLGTRNTSITNNTFLYNGRNGYDPEGRNLWYCGTVGNYWSDYAGVDRDCDGIGDTPHIAPVDRYPLIASPWQCALPVNDVCASHCFDSTDVLKAVQPVPATPCATPCTTASSCTATPSCAAPSCEPEVKTCGDQILTCASPTAILTAEFCPSAPSCAPCTIEWLLEGALVGTGPSLQVSTPGIYTARITGADGCGVSKSITVVSDANAPVVHTTVTGELSCAGGEAVLEAMISGGCGPYTIEWTRSGMGVLGCDSCLSVTEPGTYTVVVTGANGCTTIDSVTVLQDLQSPRVEAVVSDELTCGTRQVKLTALASNGKLPYTYEWRYPNGDLAGTANEVYVSQAGTYTVRVAGSNGCSAVGSVIVTEDALAPVIDIRVAGSGILTCSIPEATLTANISQGRPPYAIEWEGPSGNLLGTAPVLEADQPGVYTVTVRGANGCASSASYELTQDVAPPVVDAGPDHELSNEVTSVTVTPTITNPSGSYTVEWTDETGAVLATTESFTITRPGEYTITVTRSTGCTASDKVTVNSEIITEVMLDSGIVGLAVFGQLTIDGVPIPGSDFHFKVESVDPETGVEISAVSLRTGEGDGYIANGAEVNYIIPGNSTVTFQIHADQFVAGKWYNLPHLPVDPPGEASVKFF